MYIKLMNNATGYMLVLFKDKNLVFTVKKGKVEIQQEYRTRTEFVINTGTMKITDVEEDDAGRYTLDVYTPRKTLVKTLSFTLQIKGEYNGTPHSFLFPHLIQFLMSRFHVAEVQNVIIMCK